MDAIRNELADPASLVEEQAIEACDCEQEKTDAVCSAEIELSNLKETLRQEELRRREQEEFSSCFPDVTLAEVPDSVKESAVSNNLPLAAAYALYLCRKARAKESARAASERAAAETPGLPTGDRGERIYTIEEMRAMSQSEVRRRYSALLNSLSRGIETIH